MYLDAELRDRKMVENEWGEKNKKKKKHKYFIYRK